MKTLTVGSKLQVYNGTAEHTSGGLEKKDIVKVVDKKSGIVRYKSKIQHANGGKPNKKSQNARAAWTQATKKAYKYLQSPHEDEKGVKKITEALADKYSSSFVSMKKAPINKQKPTINERLYIITRLFYDKSM